MNDLVFLKNDEAFTDSLVIANKTGNSHHAVTQLIRKHQKRLEKYGSLEFKHFKCVNPKGGRPTKVYQLNEPQATLLITFLDNTDIVADFKTELVGQFYKMRKFIMERQTTEWSQMRSLGKLTRKAETDTIKELVELAKEQGSAHADMLYMTYSKLANKMAGIDKRDTASFTQLNDLNIFEQIILNIIRQGIIAEKHYKEIYKDCKDRCEMAKQVAFIGG